MKNYQAGADGFDCSIAENGEIIVSILADKKTKTRAAIIFPPEECHKLLEPGTDIVIALYHSITFFYHGSSYKGAACFIIPDKSVIAMVWDDVIYHISRCQLPLSLTFGTKWMLL